MIDTPTLRRMLEEATPEPWECDVDGQHTRDGNALEYFATDPDGLRVFDTLNAHRDELTIEPDEDGVTYSDKRQRANADLICALRNSAAELLDELERLREANAVIHETRSETAAWLAEALGIKSHTLDSVSVTLINEALRRERERCARIAEDEAANDRYTTEGADAAKTIARRIREGTP